jgi:hypothetical protein
MAFYVAKGLQIAGLVGMPLALYVGFSQEGSMARELGLAALCAGTFYVGYLIESR